MLKGKGRKWNGSCTVLDKNTHTHKKKSVNSYVQNLWKKVSYLKLIFWLAFWFCPPFSVLSFVGPVLHHGPTKQLPGAENSTKFGCVQWELIFPNFLFTWWPCIASKPNMLCSSVNKTVLRIPTPVTILITFWNSSSLRWSLGKAQGAMEFLFTWSGTEACAGPGHFVW